MFFELKIIKILKFMEKMGCVISPLICIFYTKTQIFANGKRCFKSFAEFYAIKQNMCVCTFCVARMLT